MTPHVFLIRNKEVYVYVNFIKRKNIPDTFKLILNLST